MKFAICNEIYVDWSFADAFAHAAGLGYKGIEIAPFTINRNANEISQSRRREIRCLAAANDLEIVGLHWLLAETNGYHLTDNDPEVRAATGRYLVKLAELCRDLGGNVMVFGSPAQRNRPPGVSDAEGFDRTVDVFQSVAESLQEFDVTLAIEPLGPEEGNFITTARSAIEIVKAVDSPHVRLQLDVKAMSTEAIPIGDIIRSSKPWLAHFHANDPNRRGPGMGSVDYLPIFSALKDIGYEGWISVEVFDYSPGIEKLAGESINYLQDVERKAGLV